MPRSSPALAEAEIPVTAGMSWRPALVNLFLRGFWEDFEGNGALLA